jgi:hypothetical protein
MASKATPTTSAALWRDEWATPFVLSMPPNVLRPGQLISFIYVLP